MTRKSGKSGPDRTTLRVAAMWFFGVLITNIMLVLITDDVFMHLGQVASGQVHGASKMLPWRVLQNR